MSKKIKRFFLRMMRRFFSPRMKAFVAWLLTKRVTRRIYGYATDRTLEFLLASIDLCFFLWDDYRENIKDFQGRYVFRTSGGLVEASAVFADGDMEYDTKAIEEYDVRITFDDPAAVQKFLLSKNQDILEQILNNTVKIEGNLNYIYRFGFLLRDLEHRLGTL